MRTEEYHFEKLIQRYAGKRKICNCGQAYYDKSGNCPDGCSSNQITAKYYIAKKALREITQSIALQNKKGIK